MILYTSDIRKKYKKTFITYICITLFCILFNYIYEQFSYGESSPYMRFMFAVSAIGGIIPFFIAFWLSPTHKYTLWEGRIAFNLWNCAIAIMISGCLVTGIIEISGRTCEYSMFYWIGGVIFLLTSILCSICYYLQPHES